MQQAVPEGGRGRHVLGPVAVDVVLRCLRAQGNAGQMPAVQARRRCLPLICWSQEMKLHRVIVFTGGK